MKYLILTLKHFKQKVKGIVVKSTGSWYEVKAENGELYQARLKGKFRIKGIKSTNPVAVGDHVEIAIDSKEVLITQIEARKNYIIRKSINLSKQVQIIAANIDQLFLLVTLKQPLTTKGFVDRVLVGAEAYRIPAVLLFNKVDLLDKDDLKELQSWEEIYKKAGYEMMEISVAENIGLENVEKKMKNKVSMLTGNSGVGKSTLINALDANLSLKSGKISDYHQSGMHTTTFAEMFDFSFGGQIIDTPGVKGFGNVEIEKTELHHYFPEMRERMNECKYNNCIHVNEPGCAVKEAVENSEIAVSRYNNYLYMLEEDSTETFRGKSY